MAPVRLRLRPRRSPAGSASSSRPFDAWTTVGNLDSPRRATVDPSGRVAPGGAGWLLEWWIGAEDRWHQPSQEAAVRQQLVGGSPVVETRVKIPSGDAVARCYGARGPGGEDLAVLEVENASKVPVALALVVRAAEGGGVESIRLDGTVLEVDGEVVHLARSPGRFAMSTRADPRDAGAMVLAGDAEPVRAHQVGCAEGDAQGVLLFPLAHTATFRAAVALDPVDGPVEPATLPSAPQVASGWATHSRAGARIEVPDRRWRDAIAASTRHLLLEPTEPAAALALEHLGLGDAHLPSGHTSIDSDDTGTALATIAAAWRFRRQVPGSDARWVAGLVQRWTGSSRPADQALGHAALPAVAEVLRAMAEERAADDVLHIHRSERPPATVPDDPFALLASASPTWTWSTERSGHDLAVNAAFLLAVRALLVDDAGDGLRLSPVVPDTWLGQGWEVHDLPTAHGLLSFAIRWHGERPALLWQLDPRPGAPSVELRCSLDAAWSSTEPSGEALLAAVPVPERPARRRGLSIPVSIEPIRRRP
jgi:hypothetical protein